MPEENKENEKKAHYTDKYKVALNINFKGF